MNNLPYSKKSWQTPDKSTQLDKAELRIIELGGYSFSKAVCAPGWRWTTDLGPKMSSDRCKVPHVGLVLKGSIAVKDVETGQEMVVNAGEVYCCPPGHDAWVVGNEEVQVIDVAGQMQPYLEVLKH